MRYHAQNRRRLEALRRTPEFNAIDYVEVSDSSAPSHDLRQRTLILQLLQPLAAGIVPSWRDVTITGGDRFAEVAIEWVARVATLPAGESLAPYAQFDDPDTLLVVRTRRDDPSRGRGDHSMYTLRIEPDSWGFDARLADVEFSFKVECPSRLDCACDCRCTAEAHDDGVEAPAIDYLAKDFPSLRRLMLDRMRVLMPEWRERHAPDLLIALTELVAYRADQLSYRQDAIATEALAAIARDRVALRRHARMLDYRVDEGVAARTYVRFALAVDPANPVAVSVDLPPGIPLLTAENPDSPVLDTSHRELRNRILSDPATIVFETIEHASLSSRLSELRFWGYGELEPVLPAGATSATLRGAVDDLRIGDALLLAETTNPLFGAASDAGESPDPQNRQIVRITSVLVTEDLLGGSLTGGPAGPLPITEIEWAADDALRRPLCLTADEGRRDAAHAFGNLVVADHGMTMPTRDLPPVPEAVLRYPEGCDDESDELAPRYRPRLPTRSLVFAEPLTEVILRDVSDDSAIRTALQARQLAPVRTWLKHEGIVFVSEIRIAGRATAWSVSDGARTVLIDKRGDRLVILEPPASISALLRPDSTRALPAVSVTRGDPPGAEHWEARLDLIGSSPGDRHVVAETDSAGATWLRFGDDIDGRRPERLIGGAVAGVIAPWRATWRERRRGSGGIGRDTLHVVDAVDLPAVDPARRVAARAALAAVTSLSNPLPATGGRPPVSDETIRREAPYAIWDQRRAVTPADYAARASSAAGVQRAAATVLWTGSWFTTAIAVDPLGGGAMSGALQEGIHEHVEPWRMAGGDLELDDAVPVALTIDLDIEVHADQVAPHVERRLLRELGSSRAADGQPALFHPDRVSFGEDVALSPIIATAAAVPGVRAVTVRAFRRSEGDTTDRIAEGVIPLGRLEIARCDNDPDHPDRGLLSLHVRGGR